MYFQNDGKLLSANSKFLLKIVTESFNQSCKLNRRNRVKFELELYFLIAIVC